MVDVDTIHKDILSALPSDTSTSQYLSAPIPADSRWSLGADSLLRLDNRIYVPDINDLRLWILRYKHDHPLSGHFGQAHTLDLIRREYTWLGIGYPHFHQELHLFLHLLRPCQGPTPQALWLVKTTPHS